jgi:hypothetical protein
MAPLKRDYMSNLNRLMYASRRGSAKKRSPPHILADEHFEPICNPPHILADQDHLVRRRRIEMGFSKRGRFSNENVFN